MSGTEVQCVYDVGNHYNKLTVSLGSAVDSILDKHVICFSESRITSYNRIDEYGL